MFDLEKSILDWRKRMLSAGIKTPVPLDELEIHLREEIERQVKSGLDGQTAFEISVQQIGQPKILGGEFKKSERTFMNRTTKTCMCIASILLGAALTVPGSIQLRNELVIANGKLGLWFLGGFLICWSFVFFQRMIHPKVFRGEFDEIEMTPLKRAIKTGAGISVLLAGLAFMFPAAGQVWREGLVEFSGLSYAVFGFALLITGALVSFCPYQKRKA